MSTSKRIVYTYGAYDLIHMGHIKLLQRAKELGDYLVVGVLSDEAVRNRKGKDRPIQPWNDRIDMVSSIKYVDETVLQQTYDALPNLEAYPDRISVITKGDDINVILDVARKYGCECIPLEYTGTYSTSQLIREIRSDSQ